LLLAKQAQTLINDVKRYYHPQYTMQAALTLSRIFEQKGDGLAAMHQYKVYNRIADSLAQVLKKSRFDVVQTQMAFEKTLMQKNELMQAQQYEKKLRIAMAAGMLLLVIIGWLLYLRKMTANKKEAEDLLQQKKLAEADTEAAKQQLELYTNSLYEKNELIEKLRRQAIPFQPQDLIEQSILTEEDWLRFRSMFDKVYPDFFTRLTNLASDVTQAEQRMAALIRLGVGNKQIATMLGVSVDTVRKSKSRLRQRLQLSVQQDLDQIIAGL
jgi:DNA-binding CsgD family transcriptional regulator